MAKFSIALCILIVACGAQATTISESAVTAWAENKIAEVKQLLQSATDALSNTTAPAENMVESIESTIQTGLDDWNTMVEEAAAKYVNGSSCTSTSANFTETAKEMFSEVIDCVEDSLASNKAKYEAAVNTSEALITELEGFVTEAEACAANNQTSEACLLKLVKSEGKSIATAVSTFAKEMVAIIAAFNSFPSDPQACGYSSTIQTVVTEGQEAYTTIEDCLANLNSTSR